MNVFRNVFLVSLVVLAAGAFAQIDPDPNGIGVYFDEMATVVATDSNGQTYVQAYLVLTNPTEIDPIVFWKVLVYSPDTSPDAIWGVTRSGENQAVHMPGSPYFFFRVIDIGGVPFIPAPITILADLYVDTNLDQSPIGLYINYHMQYSTVGAEGPLIDCTPSSGSEDLPVASIDGLAPVAVESQSWGQVKSIFR